MSVAGGSRSPSLISVGAGYPGPRSHVQRGEEVPYNVSYTMMHVTLPSLLWADRHACENITFRKFCLWAVIMLRCRGSLRCWFYNSRTSMQEQISIKLRNSPFYEDFWDHWYPCFGLLVTSSLGFKARVGSLIHVWQRHMYYMFPEIHLWCDTCWPLGS